MAKLRTNQRINWGGWNPFIKNFIEIEVTEIYKNEIEVCYSIRDIVIGENGYFGENNEVLINEFVLQVIRDKTFKVPIELYNQLYLAVEQQMPQNSTPFEKDILRPKLALLFYFQNDKILDDQNNEFCLYGTQPNDWSIV